MTLNGGHACSTAGHECLFKCDFKLAGVSGSAQFHFRIGNASAYYHHFEEDEGDILWECTLKSHKQGACFC